jgi:hypothetical protein
MDAVWKTLANDATLLGYLGLTTSSSTADKAKKLVREEEASGAVDSSKIPQILMYIRPGLYDSRNAWIYKNKFVLDFYAANSNLAQRMAGRCFELFHDQILGVPGKTSFRCFLAYETSFATGIQDVKGFRQYYDHDYVK